MGGFGLGGGQGGYERRIEVFVKIQKKIFLFGGGGIGGGGEKGEWGGVRLGGGGQDKCERRIEVFVKMM